MTEEQENQRRAARRRTDPDGVVVGAGQQHDSVGGELDAVDPAQVTAEIRHLLSRVQVPQLVTHTHTQRQRHTHTFRERHSHKDTQRHTWDLPR